MSAGLYRHAPLSHAWLLLRIKGLAHSLYPHVLHPSFDFAMILYIASLALAVAPAVLAQNVAICTDGNFTWVGALLVLSPTS